MKTSTSWFPVFTAMALLVSQNTMAQFKALPDSNAQWVVHRYSGPDFDGEEWYSIGGREQDTIINGLVYHDMGAGLGGIRDGGQGQVYYHEYFADTTYLLYDFDLAVGDTVFDLYSRTGNLSMYDTVFVTSVDSVLILNTWRKRIGVYVDGGVDSHWVQGIGGVNFFPGVAGGGIITAIPWAGVSMSYHLHCVSVNDTIEYHYSQPWLVGTDGTCFPVQSVHEQASTLGILNAHPNPNNGLCTIDLPQSLRATDDLVLSMYDNTGQLVQRAPLQFSEQGLKLDILAQAKGIYHVELGDGQQRYTGTIVFE